MNARNAATLHADIITAAATAPTKAQIKDAHQAHTDSGTTYPWPAHVEFKTATGRLKLSNCAERLQSYARELLRGANWAAFGGGVKPMAAKPRATSWPSGSVKLVAEMLEDGQTGEAAVLAIQKCGALFFTAYNTPFMAWAPQTVEGLPACLASVRASVAGNKWQVLHLETGHKLGFNCSSRKAAEDSALDAWQALTDAQRAMVPDMKKDHDTEAARAEYLEAAGVTDSIAIEDLQADPAPVRKAQKTKTEFSKRVAFAKKHMLAKRKSGRAFDGCFEMWDGDAVAAAIYSETLKNEKLAAVAWCYLSSNSAKSAFEKCPFGFDFQAWSDALISEALTHKAATPAQSVAQVVAEAATAAAIEAAQESATAEAMAEAIQPEAEVQETAEALATCSAAKEGQGSHQAGRAMISRVAGFAVDIGQVISGKAGNWSAVFFNCPKTGLPSMRFMHSEEDGRGQDAGTYENGRERMADLQRRAKAADYAAKARALFDAQAEAVSLSKMIERGIKPQDLVGLGIKYSGDMANAPGEGAIVAFELTQHSERITLQLEDGREWIAQAHSFTPGIGCRLAINWKMHGRPYLAQLAAAVAAKKAAGTAKKETQAQAFEAETQRLITEYPHLQQVAHGGGKEAAKNARIMLKNAFPRVKFSVTSDYSSLTIKWTDGPTDAQVNEVIGRFDIGRSDIQTDYFYTQESPWSKLFGGVQYLWTYRTESPELVARVITQFFEGRHLQATAEDYIQNKGVFDWRTGDEFTRRQFAEVLHSTAA